MIMETNKRICDFLVALQSVQLELYKNNGNYQLIIICNNWAERPFPTINVAILDRGRRTVADVSFYDWLSDEELQHKLDEVHKAVSTQDTYVYKGVAYRNANDLIEAINNSYENIYDAKEHL